MPAKLIFCIGLGILALWAIKTACSAYKYPSQDVVDPQQIKRAGESE